MKLKGMTARQRYRRHAQIDTIDGTIMLAIGIFFTFFVGGLAMLWGIPSLFCTGLSFRDANKARTRP